MSKNAISDSGLGQKPDNPQETKKVENFYYSGFMSAEMSCSVIKAKNVNPEGYYYAVDFTVSNADSNLLEEVKRVVMKEGAIVSPIKGAFNLKARGRNRVRAVLGFLDQYPIIAGDLARNRIDLLRQALEYLEANRGSSKQQEKIVYMDDIRSRLRKIKTAGKAEQSYREKQVSKDAVGHFLAGVLDGDGSFGLKKSRDRDQPFVMLAMKDRKIVEMLQKFVQHGKVRWRSDGVYHYEINHRDVLKKVCKLFLKQYPLRHAGQKNRMLKIQRILNDYTRSSVPEWHGR